MSCHTQLLEEAVGICEGRLQAQQTQVVAYLDKQEDWTIEAASNKSGIVDVSHICLMVHLSLASQQLGCMQHHLHIHQQATCKMPPA